MTSQPIKITVPQALAIGGTYRPCTSYAHPYVELNAVDLLRVRLELDENGRIVSATRRGRRISVDEATLIADTAVYVDKFGYIDKFGARLSAPEGLPETLSADLAEAIKSRLAGLDINITVYEAPKVTPRPRRWRKTL